MRNPAYSQPGSRRSGTLSLRDQYLSPAHLAVLRLDDLEIDLACRPRSGSTVKSTEFNDISITITNRLGMPIRESHKGTQTDPQTGL